MAETYKGMEPLPGFTDINTEVEQSYPGIRYIFDRMLLSKAPPDIYNEIAGQRDEFPIEAAIVIPDSETGYLRTL